MSGGNTDFFSSCQQDSRISQTLRASKAFLDRKRPRGSKNFVDPFHSEDRVRCKPPAQVTESKRIPLMEISINTPSPCSVMYAFVMHLETLPKSYHDFIQKTGPVAAHVYKAVGDSCRGGPVEVQNYEVGRGVVCMHRKVALKDHKLVYWIAGGISALAILLEKEKSRRAELALYVLPRGGDSLASILVSLHLLPEIRNAEVALFCACMGGISSDAITIRMFSPDTMNTRLFEAARAGNLEDLKDLLRENPLILHTVSLFCTNNPLHIASAAGHACFVREITRLRTDFAKELNEDGFSPIHIAAANGNDEVVEELLKVDPNLCRLEGKEKKTPFHSAAIKGKVDVIRVMLQSCADCIEDVTIQQETALHLAIRSNRFEAVEVLVGWIREKKKDSILNLVDEQNNTVLHLATWKKQRQVIELLLGNTGSMEVNAINQSGLTALDLLQIFPSEAGDMEIAENLQRAGAKRARDLTLAPPMPESSNNHHHVVNVSTTPEEVPLSHPRNLVEYFKFKKGRDKPSQARTSLLIIAVLVATATFQVGLSPPGGVWQENYVPSQNSTDKPHTAGASVMASANGVTFLLFVIFNSIGFCMSLYMINILTSKFPLQLELRVCIIAMYITYNIAMASISPPGLTQPVTIVTNILSSSTPFVTRNLEILIFNFRKRFCRRESS